jgi:3-oxoacid CoA-transferase subunit B
LVANYIPPNVSVIVQGENGLLGIGPYPTKDQVDSDVINPSKETVSIVPGGVAISSVEAFAMIRGGHIDLTVLGAMEVDEEGNLANWMIPGKRMKGIGGAMDLVAGAKRVIVAMQHISKDGVSKVMPKCQLPLTGSKVVSLIVTELAVIEVTLNGLLLLERAPGVSVDQIIQSTAAKLIVPLHVPEISFPNQNQKVAA